MRRLEILWACFGIRLAPGETYNLIATACLLEHLSRCVRHHMRTAIRYRDVIVHEAAHLLATTHDRALRIRARPAVKKTIRDVD